MVTKKDKEETIAKLQEGVKTAGVAFVADHTKLTVEEITNLRRAMKGKGKCVVIKNTLANRAFAGSNFENLGDFLAGPSLLVLGEGEDIAQSIKTFLDFQNKIKPKLSIKGGVLAEDGKALSSKSIEEIGNLPSKEVILAQIAAALTSTPAQIVQSINQIISGIGDLAVQVAEKNSK